MAYTKNYYHILGLGLGTPTAAGAGVGAAAGSTTAQPKSGVLRRAYRNALLAAHPDKRVRAGDREDIGNENGNGNEKDGSGGGRGSRSGSVYTVDDVKEAFAILDDPAARAAYDGWVLRNPHALAMDDAQMQTQTCTMSEDFFLGLDVLDLSEFEELPGDEGADAHTDANTDVEGERGGEMQWCRACRCGDTKGFCVREGELEEALARGEGEVLVGCRGCSLWVRVGFGVEEG